MRKYEIVKRKYQIVSCFLIFSHFTSLSVNERQNLAGFFTPGNRSLFAFSQFYLSVNLYGVRERQLPLSVRQLAGVIRKKIPLRFLSV